MRNLIAVILPSLLASIGSAEEPAFFAPLLEPVEAVGYLTDGSTRPESALPQATDVPAEELPLRRFKKQAVQSVSVSGRWLAATSGDDLSSSYLETSLGLGIPLGSLDNILGVTPAFRVDWVDAAAGLDIPAQLYETGVQFFWRRPLSDRWSAMAIVDRPTAAISRPATTHCACLRSACSPGTGFPTNCRCRWEPSTSIGPICRCCPPSV